MRAITVDMPPDPADSTIDLPPDLGSRLRLFREHNQLPAETPALACGITARVIGDWERGYRIPRLVHLRKLAGMYGIPLSLLTDAIPDES